MRHCPRSLVNVNSSTSHNRSHGQDYRHFTDMKTELMKSQGSVTSCGLSLSPPHCLSHYSALPLHASFSSCTSDSRLDLAHILSEPSQFVLTPQPGFPPPWDTPPPFEETLDSTFQKAGSSRAGPFPLPHTHCPPSIRASPQLQLEYPSYSGAWGGVLLRAASPVFWDTLETGSHLSPHLTAVLLQEVPCPLCVPEFLPQTSLRGQLSHP